MGESPIRGNVSHGDGVYKSTDAGQTLEERRSARHAADLARPRPSEQPRPRLRRGAGARLGPERGARASSARGRRQELEEGPLRRRQDRRLRSRDGSRQPPDPVRRLLAGRAAPVGARQSGGPGASLWKSTDGGDTWKKLTGRALPEGDLSATSAWRSRPPRPEPRLGHRRGQEERRPLPQRRRRRELDARQRRAQDPRARLVLHAGSTRTRRTPDASTCPNVADAPVHRRRQDLFDRSACRTATTTTSGSIRTTPSRMILGNDGGATITFNGGQDLVDAGQPADRPVLPRRDRRPVPVLGLRRAAGQLDRRDPVGVRRRRHRTTRLARGRRRRERLGRARPEGSRSRLCRRLRRPDHALRPPAPAERKIVAWPQLAIGQAAKDLKYRFQWNAPIVISPHDPNMLYHAVADSSAQPRRGPDAGRRSRPI